MLQTKQDLPCNSFKQIPRHALELRLLDIVVQTHVEHLCDYEKVSPEYKTVEDLKQVVLIWVSPYDTHENPCLYLSVFEVCFVVFIDFDGDWSSILLHIQTHQHLAKGSCAESLLDLVSIAQLFTNVGNIQAVF